MIVVDLLGADVEDLEPRTQEDEFPIDVTQDVIVAEDDPEVPPFSPPGS
jgi:hypothetical protein